MVHWVNWGEECERSTQAPVQVKSTGGADTALRLQPRSSEAGDVVQRARDAGLVPDLPSQWWCNLQEPDCCCC